MIERLRACLAAPNPYLALDAEFSTVDKVVSSAPCSGLDEPRMQHELVRLLGAFVREGDAFFDRIDRPGWGRRAAVAALTAHDVAAAS